MLDDGRPTSSIKARIVNTWTRFVRIYDRDIWQSAFLKDRSPKGISYAVLRVISITITAFFESRIATRAAALSFSSLLSLGPLLVIAVLVAGFALGPALPDDSEPPATAVAITPANPGDPAAAVPEGRKKVVADTLNRLIKIVLPQIAQYEENAESEQKTQNTGKANPQLVEIIDDIITKSRSGSAGAASIFSLLLIVLLLFKSIEDTFNDIWGVRQGRSVLMRVVLYWTILTLGAILFFTAVAMLGAGTYLNVFADDTADNPDVKWFFLIQMFSLGLLTVMLTLFYRVIPNTRVFWRAAFLGGLVVGALLLGNNFVQILYVKRVLLERNLYGSLAIVPVLMFGLYIFWLFVLIGGVVSYALQNVHFRNSQAVWSTLTEAMRERMTLVVFLTICRRFRDCLPPVSVSELSEMLKVPSQLLNECLNRLVRLEVVTTLRPPPDTPATDYLYQPARPLNRITLFDFKTLNDNLGEDLLGAPLEQIDPLVSQYEATLNHVGEDQFFQKTVEELFNEHPFADAQPPFALGARQRGK